MEFASTFDAALAAGGPTGVFARNHDGEWKLSENLTRDAWGRAPDAPRDPAFVLFRDRDTGFVSLFFVTARALVLDHPRADVRFVDSQADALTALAALGRPPVVDTL